MTAFPASPPVLVPPRAHRAASLVERLRVARVDPSKPPPFAAAKPTAEDLWSSALIHSWAEVMEILQFYQDRIRAEGYADTAVEALSRRLLQAGLGLRRAGSAGRAIPRPGEPVPLVLDPGCAASADFVLRLRAAPGLPAAVWLPAGAQFRHHAVDAPSVAIFESEASVSLREDWNDLPLRPAARGTGAALGGTARVPTGDPSRLPSEVERGPVGVPAEPRLAAGAPGVLVAAAGPRPRVGDGVLAVAGRGEDAWFFREVAAVSPAIAAGVCEVVFDRPLADALDEPRIELMSRRTPVFGWDAADFAALPAAARRRAARGSGDGLAGGLRLVEAGAASSHNDGLPEGTPRAVAVGAGSVVHLATDGGLASLGADRAWRPARSGAATRGVSCLACAPDGLLMIGTASGRVFTTYDPARGADRLAGGYVLEAGARPGDAPRPVKAALTGGAVRGLMAFGDPASRVMALTDAGLFEYDPRGAWLTATARPLHGGGAFRPVPALLGGARLTAALVTEDRGSALLAFGSTVLAVRLGPPAPPSTLVLGALDAAADVGVDPDPAPASLRWRWSFPDPVTALAFLAPSGPSGWDSFLAVAGDGMFRCDWLGREPARDGLPDGRVDALLAVRLRDAWRVRAVHSAGVYGFDAELRIWSCEVAAGSAGPILAAADGNALAVVQPLALPADWPGFALADSAALDLPGPGLACPAGSSVVLTSPGGAALPATVVASAPAAFDGFGLRERGLRVSLVARDGADPAAFRAAFGRLDRRTAVVHIGGPALVLVAPPRGHDRGTAPGATLDLAGAWDDLVAPPPPDLPAGRTSGVAGAASLPVRVDAPQVAQPWGLQPLDLAGVAAAAAVPGPVSARRRIALSGQAARVVPAAPGGVLRWGDPPSGTGDAPRRNLPGFDIRALAAAGGVVLAAAEGHGVYAGRGGAWAPANAGLPIPLPSVTALAAAGGPGAAPRFVLAAAGAGIFAAGADLVWARLAPPPPTAVAALAVLLSGAVLAGGAGGLFCWDGTAWAAEAGGSPAAAGGIAALLSLGDRALAAPAAGGVLAGAPGRGWVVWAEALDTTAVSAFCADGPRIWIAAADGAYAAEAGGSPVRRLEATGATAVAASRGRAAVAVPGAGVFASDGGSDWTRRAVGLNNDLTAVLFDADGRLLAGAGGRLRLRDPAGVWVPHAVPPRSGVAAAPGLAAALDAGLCAPLRAASPPAVAGLVADGSVVTVVEPGLRWTVGPPGRDLGGGALMLEAEADGVAFRPAFGPFTVAAAVGDAADGAPWGLSLAGRAGEGFAEAWPGDLAFAPPEADAPRLTCVRAVVAARVAGDATSLTLDRALGLMLDPAGARASANVVGATQGETVAGERLGSGDASRAFQAFKLRRSPLTFTATADGGRRSTLRVFVDGVEWGPVGSLLGSGPSARVYVAEIGADDRVEVRFGDGVTGARLPAGRDNVQATYRTGLREVGDVGEGATTLLAARPSIAAVRGVPRTPARPPEDGLPEASRPAAGGGPEFPARAAGPGPLRSAGRLVTAADYAAYAEALPRVAAARADAMRVRGRDLLHLSVAWAEPEPEPAAVEALLRQIRAGAAAAGAVPAPPFAVATCASLPFRVAARLWLADGAAAEAARAAARAALQGLFADSAIGAPVRRAAVEEALQAVPGVSGVAVDALHVAGRPARPNERLDASPARPLASGAIAPAQRLVLDRGAAGLALAVVRTEDAP